MDKHLVGICATALLASGCATPYSEAPLATNFPTSDQQKLQAAAHWNTIAADIARQLAAMTPGKSPLYVRQPALRSPFERAIANQLTTSLLAAGHPVMKSPEGALTVDLDVQSVAFSANRPQYRYTGAATALGAGVWALHDIVANSSNGAAAAGMLALAAGDTLAWFQSRFASGETPQTEVIVNTSVSNAREFVARTTSVYYVADRDRGLYAESLPTKTFHLKGE
jgi:hypothetical protein